MTSWPWNFVHLDADGFFHPLGSLHQIGESYPPYGHVRPSFSIIADSPSACRAGKMRADLPEPMPLAAVMNGLAEVPFSCKQGNQGPPWPAISTPHLTQWDRDTIHVAVWLSFRPWSLQNPTWVSTPEIKRIEVPASPISRGDVGLKTWKFHLWTESHLILMETLNLETPDGRKSTSSPSQDIIGPWFRPLCEYLQNNGSVTDGFVTRHEWFPLEFLAIGL